MKQFSPLSDASRKAVLAVAQDNLLESRFAQRYATSPDAQAQLTSKIEFWKDQIKRLVEADQHA